MAALNRYGHPLGKPLRSTEVAPYRRQVASLYARFPSHPGLLAGETILSDLLRLAQSDLRDRDFADHALRLSVSGVTPRELLERVGAVFLLARDDPRQLPDDARLDFALARAVLYARPLRRLQTRKGYSVSVRPTATTCRKLGQFLRSRLAMLFHLAGEYFDQQRQRREEQAAAMRTPFVNYKGTAATTS